MTFTNEKATISYDVWDTPDGKRAYVHSLDGDEWAMRQVIREMEADLARCGFDRYYVVKDIAKEADEIRYVKEFKMGVQIAFPDEIIKHI